MTWHFPLTFDPQEAFLCIHSVSLVPKRGGGGGGVGVGGRGRVVGRGGAGNRDPLILYLNKILPFLIIAMTVNLTIS